MWGINRRPSTVTTPVTVVATADANTFADSLRGLVKFASEVAETEAILYRADTKKFLIDLCKTKSNEMIESAKKGLYVYHHVIPVDLLTPSLKKRLIDGNRFCGGRYAYPCYDNSLVHDGISITVFYNTISFSWC